MTLEELFNGSYISSYDTSTHRVCGACGEIKPFKDFYKDGKYSDGRTRYRRDCRACYKAARWEEAKFKKTGQKKGS